MKKTPLYSRSRRPVEVAEATPAALPAPAAAAASTRRGRLMALLGRHERKVWALALAVLALGMWYGNPALSMKAPLTIEQIDAAMRQSIEDKPLLSPATRAYEAIFPSVVRVVGLMTEGEDDGELLRLAHRQGPDAVFRVQLPFAQQPFDKGLIPPGIESARVGGDLSDIHPGIEVDFLRHVAEPFLARGA